jgi:hypothetical protein
MALPDGTALCYATSKFYILDFIAGLFQAIFMPALI